VRIALANHPALQAAAMRVEAAHGRRTQTSLWPNPSFVFEGEALGSDAGRGGETIYKIEQAFPTGERRARAEAVARADAARAEIESVGAAFDVAAFVRHAFIAVVAAGERTASRRELLGLADEILAAVEAQIEAGVGAEPDRLRAVVVRERAALALRRAEKEEAAARDALANAMGLDSLSEAPILGSLQPDAAPPPHDDALRIALTHNARIRAAESRVERARREHDLARAGAAPEVVGAIGPRYSDPDNDTTLDVGLGVEIPIYDRNQGAISAAVAERTGAAADLAGVRLSVMNDMRAARAEYEAALLSVDAHEDALLPAAERSLRLTEEAHRAGKIDYLRLIDAQQVYVETRLGLLDALEALRHAAVSIEHIMQDGTPRPAPSAKENAS